MLDHTAGSPAVLFDGIPGYPVGRRVLVNTLGTLARQALVCLSSSAIRAA